MTPPQTIAAPNDLAACLAAWREVVGDQHVEVDEPTLAATATATFATTQRVAAVVRPADRDQLQACVRMANRHRVAIYPISCGKNWGYGSRVPVQDGSVVVDLGRMNRISDFNETLGHVVVEPGVTQQQLFDYLRQHNSQLMMSVTGSSPYSSIIGNFMERGIGLGRYGDRWNHVCGLEVVLPSGDCIHTGYGRFENAAATHVARDGVGPWLDGLFTQSRFGIVTRMTLWLLPRPQHFQVFLCWLRDQRQLEQFFEAARTLRMEGTINSTLAAFNDIRTLTFMRRYPWQATGGATPLPQPLRAQLTRECQAASWMATGTLYSPSRAQARADSKRVRKVLRGRVDKLIFINGTIARIGRAISPLYQWLTGIDLAEKMNSLFFQSPYLGQPIDEGIASTYWRKQIESPERPYDLDRDRCGVVFCGQLVPCEAAHVATAVRIVEDVSAAHGFEPVMNLSAITERTVHVIITILYDRDTPGEDARAAACHDALVRDLAARGYLPYRLGIHSMQSLPPAVDDYDQLLTALRQTLDPNNILAPGRYE